VSLAVDVLQWLLITFHTWMHAAKLHHCIDVRTRSATAMAAACEGLDLIVLLSVQSIYVSLDANFTSEIQHLSLKIIW